jgi:hypothetical protein
VTGAAQPAVFLGVGGTASRPRLLLPLPVPELPPPKRARAKLWELNESIHCSIIGTCLTTAELRRVMGKVLNGDVSRVSDHDLHAQAVGLCNHHNAGSKLLQKALDGRHETVVKRFTALQGDVAVMQAWAEARRAGDIPGAYWAVLTHPDVGLDGLRRAFGDVHMLSHLVGAANRADIRRLQALEEENAALRAKVDRQQVRLHEAVTSRDATIRRLGALAAGQVAGAADPADDDALTALRHLVGDLQSRLGRETGRRERLALRLAEAQEAAQSWKTRAAAAEVHCEAAQAEVVALERHRAVVGDTLSAPALPARRILYVGGRPGTVDGLRELLETAGGTLLAHDGGRHDHPSLLPGLISQADQVAFPVDCISHDAALTVKRLCRQIGKSWTPLRSSGLGSFLAAFSVPDTHMTNEATP